MNSQKKLKLIISSLKDKQVIKFFETFINCYSSTFNKNIRQISFNCYQSICQFKNKIVNGYGKNSNQAFINGIRNLIDILIQQEKNHNIIKDCLRKISNNSNSNISYNNNIQSNNKLQPNNNYDSQKKLLSTQKTFKAVKDPKNQKGPLSMSTNFNYNKKIDKDKSIKEQIFQYLNLQNLKISNPNTIKTKMHDRYMNTSISQTGTNDEEEQLKYTLQKISELQKQISEATIQNQKLKDKLHLFYSNKENKDKVDNIDKQDNTYKNLKTNPNVNNININNNINTSYNNYASQNGNIEPDKNKIRSISVQPTQKYYLPQDKKIKIPKLNLQVLPNYHGNSNKSLNQSLLQVYQKSRK